MVDFDVVDLRPADHPETGTTAPDFTRPLVSSEFWEDRSLSALAAEEGGAVVVFTPMIGSFVAQYVWTELAEREWGERARVVGVSAANPYGVASFLRERDLPFEIVADPGNDVAEDYGIAHDLDGMAGLSEPRVAFFAVDADLTVTGSWVATEWPEFPDYDALEETLGLE
ncbi:redoxin domain-containing protein [Saliphagus sp. GCM10025334]